jgi:hypothetical protein
MKANKTTEQLLERLQEDQRILKQEQERLEIIREKELSQQELQRVAQSKDVLEELEKANSLLIQEDKALENQFSVLSSLKTEKKELNEKKESLDKSVQEEMDDLLQQRFDLQRQELIGLERLEEEIQAQALKEIEEKITTELEDLQSEIETLNGKYYHYNKNLEGLQEKLLLDQDIDETKDLGIDKEIIALIEAETIDIKKEIELLELAQTIQKDSILNEPENSEIIVDLEKKIASLSEDQQNIITALLEDSDLQSKIEEKRGGWIKLANATF